MQRLHRKKPSGTTAMVVLAGGMLSVLAACSSAPLSQQSRLTCTNTQQRDPTAPFHPGATCLDLAGIGPGQARSRIAGEMKAVSLNGRVFFVPERPAALARASIAAPEAQP